MALTRVISTIDELVSGASPGHELFRGPTGYVSAPGFFNVRAFGATGDGATDDTVAIQAAITAAGVGGVVVFPTPASVYRISASLVPMNYQTWTSGGYHWPLTGQPVLFSAPTFADALIKHTGTLLGWSVNGLGFYGPGALSGSKGIDLAISSYCRIENCSFNLFGDSAIILRGPTGNVDVIQRNYTQNCLMVHTGRTVPIGVFDCACLDAIIRDNEFSASVSAIVSGFIFAAVIRGNGSWVSGNGFENSEAGVQVFASQCRFSNNRADLNYGPGWIIDATATANAFIGNFSYRNGLATDNTYDGFQIAGSLSIFSGNDARNRSIDANRMRHGFTDTSTTGANVYAGNMGELLRGNLYNFSGAGTKRLIGHGENAVTKTTTYTVLDDDRLISSDATGAAFTVNLPSAAGRQGRQYTIKRTNGGANAVTVDANAAETIDGALTKILGSQYAAVVVESDGTNWSLISTLGTVT